MSDAPSTVTSKLLLATSSLRFNAVWVAVLIGLFKSLVLSTFPRPTSPFTIPNGLIIVLLVNVSAPANVTGKTIAVALEAVTNPFPFTVIVGTDVPVP